MPRKKLIVDYDYVMGLKVEGLKTLCAKNKLSKKGRKAELQDRVLVHLKLVKKNEAPTKVEPLKLEQVPDAKQTHKELNPMSDDLPEEDEILQTVQNRVLAHLKLAKMNEPPTKVDLPKPEQESHKDLNLQSNDIPKEEQNLQAIQKPESDDALKLENNDQVIKVPTDEKVESSCKRTIEQAGIPGTVRSSKKFKIESTTSPKRSEKKKVQMNQRTDAAVKIQKHYRGHIARKRVKGMKLRKAISTNPARSTEINQPPVPEDEWVIVEKPVQTEKAHESKLSTATRKPSEIIGKTKKEIEQYLNSMKPGELAKLCTMLCQYDPKLSSVLRHEVVTQEVS